MTRPRLPACPLLAVLALALALPAAPERLRAVVTTAGQVALAAGRLRIGTLTPGLFEAGWRNASLGAARPSDPAHPDVRVGEIRAPSGKAVASELRATRIDGGLRLAWRLTPEADLALHSLNVSFDLPADVLAGGRYAADADRGAFPEQFGEVLLRSQATTVLALTTRAGHEITLRFPAPTQVLLQDNRKWGPTFSVRIGPALDPARPWPKGKALDLAFDLTAPGGLDMELDEPVTLEAGPEWIPLDTRLDIAAGSALDLTNVGGTDAPAGRHGRVIARPDGQFAFEQDPETPRRFYGVNLCFGALYLTHEEAERLAERLARLGYNAVRVHHYEGELVGRGGAGDATAARPDKLAQLDDLFAALVRRGLYVTTDLYVSRPVPARAIWDGAAGDVAMDDFKMLVPVNERAFANWQGFARTLLTHVNPHTGRSYAEEPALAWLCMINEGNYGNYVGRLDERVRSDWQAAWGKWLGRRYAHRAALARAWGGALGQDQDPAAGTVPLPRDLEETARGRDLAVFLAETERETFARMKRFLRAELGVKALLTDANGWSNPVAFQAARAEFDYVDDHFYVEHPQFLERPWRLPSRCEGASPVAGGAVGGRHGAFVRVFGKPFTLTEYNYPAPARARGVGGALTGALAALQGWGAVWRFAYSHTHENLFAPARLDYFDLASDPLNQAADRAALFLFLRGDVKPAPHGVALGEDGEGLLRAPGRVGGVAPPWDALAWVMRVGTELGGGGVRRPAGGAADVVLPLGGVGPGAGAQAEVDPYGADAGAKVLEALRGRGWLEGNATDLAANRLASETGEVVVDGARDVLVLRTARTAGGFAAEGEVIEAGPVAVRVAKTDATVWVSSVDGRAIGESRRLLVMHLTDVADGGMRFGERARQTLLAWGKLPHLVRAGRAVVSIRMKEAAGARVWALSTAGERVGPVAAEVRDGALQVTLDVAGAQGASGARMMYEVEVR